MASTLCLHYQTSGNKFHVRACDIEGIKVEHLCYYGEYLSVTVSGKEIQITETLSKFSEQYQMSQMSKWQRRLYKFFRRLWS